MQTRATLAPFPSTIEFVARVDDSETTPTPLRYPGSIIPIALRIPMQRSSRVVGDLALQRTFPSSRSIITASVNVPPVSSPRPILIGKPPVGMGCGSGGPRGSYPGPPSPVVWRKQRNGFDKAFPTSASRGDHAEAVVAFGDDAAHVVREGPLLDLPEYVG